MFILNAKVKQETKYPIVFMVDGNIISSQNFNNNGTTEFMLNIDSEPHQLFLKQLGSANEKFFIKHLIDNFSILGIPYDLVYTQLQCEIIADKNCTVEFNIKSKTIKNEANLKINSSEIVVGNFSHLILKNQLNGAIMPPPLKWRYFLLELLSILICYVPYVIIGVLIAIASQIGPRRVVYLNYVSILVSLGFVGKIIYHICCLVSNSIKRNI